MSLILLASLNDLLSSVSIWVAFIGVLSIWSVRLPAGLTPDFGCITMNIKIAVWMLQLGVSLISGSWWASQIPILTVPTVWLVTRTRTNICIQSAVNVLADCTPSTTYCCTRHVSVNHLTVSYSGLFIIVPIPVRLTS